MVIMALMEVNMKKEIHIYKFAMVIMVLIELIMEKEIITNFFSLSSTHDFYYLLKYHCPFLLLSLLFFYLPFFIIF